MATPVVVVAAGASRRVGSPVEDRHWRWQASRRATALPINGGESEALRWYVEDYLRAPFAVWEESGKFIEASLPALGERLFDWLLGEDEASARILAEARAGGPVELWLRSSDPAVLALPWELLRVPGAASPLAFELAGIGRAGRGSATVLPIPGALRVLLIVSRPGGEADIGYRAVTGPLLDILDRAAGRISVELLRPPTLAELERRLAEAAAAGTPYHVLHFDGHGAVGRPPTWSAPSEPAEALSAWLDFEDERGDAHVVTRTRLVAALGPSSVPLIVLNACRSAMLPHGSPPNAAIAPALLSAGAGAVVAMSYKVQARAASVFIAEFYGALLEGEPILRALEHGREALAGNDQRPSPRGLVRLADWWVPVLYGRPGTAVRLAAEGRGPRSHRDETTASPVARTSATVIRQSIFFGRDKYFLRMERALQTTRLILLHGLGGIGKTTLTQAFAAWLRRTGWLAGTGNIVVQDLVPGLPAFDWPGLVNALGYRLIGESFLLLPANERERRLDETLDGRRDVIVLDSVENVRSLADVALPMFPPADMVALAAFVRRRAERRVGALVLLTSRASEAWLGELTRIELTGLDSDEMHEYVQHLLVDLPQARAQCDRPTFGHLLTRLGGHPWCLRLVLASLERAPLESVLAMLDGAAASGTVRNTFFEPLLGTSLQISLRQFDGDDQSRLMALALFRGIPDVQLLSWAAEDLEWPTRFGRMDQAAWANLVFTAAETGLLAYDGGTTFRLHPALPSVLAEQWIEQAGDAFAAERVAARRALVRAFGDLSRWLGAELGGPEGPFARDLLARLVGELEAALTDALALGLMDEAEAIMAALIDHWERQGEIQTLTTWLGRVILPAGAGWQDPMWLLATSVAAGQALVARDLSSARRLYELILANVGRRRDRTARLARATVSLQLGWIGLHERQLGRAGRLGRTALAGFRRLGERDNEAWALHLLARVRTRRGDVPGAVNFLQEAMATAEAAGASTVAAAASLALGEIAIQRSEVDAAYRFTIRALHHYGRTRDRLGRARAWLQLGVTAHSRDRHDVAEDWYRRALIVAEAVDDRYLRADLYERLGLLASDRGEQDSALAWIIRCATMLGEFPRSPGGWAPIGIVEHMLRYGLEAIERAWPAAVGDPMPTRVKEGLVRIRDTVAALPRNGTDAGAVGGTVMEA